MTIGGLIERHTVNRLAFMTLTFPKQVQDKRAAHRQWNSFASGWFRERYPEYCLVWERHRKGGLHLHIVAAVPFDVRTGFDFAAWDRARRESSHGKRGAAFWAATRAYGASASPELRALWTDLREAARRYKFGRANCLPIKKDGDALGRYLAKYLTKGNGNSAFPREDKGKRRVEVSKAARVATVHFQRLNTHSWVWREKFKVWAASRGCRSVDEVKALHGLQYMKWARVQILEVILPITTVYPTKGHAIAAGADVSGLPETANDISGVSSAPYCSNHSDNERRKRIFIQALGLDAGLKLWRATIESTWVGKESEEMQAIRAARHERAVIQFNEREIAINRTRNPMNGFY